MIKIFATRSTDKNQADKNQAANKIASKIYSELLKNNSKYRTINSIFSSKKDLMQNQNNPNFIFNYELFKCMAEKGISQSKLLLGAFNGGILFEISYNGARNLSYKKFSGVVLFNNLSPDSVKKIYSNNNFNKVEAIFCQQWLPSDDFEIGNSDVTYL